MDSPKEDKQKTYPVEDIDAVHIPDDFAFDKSHFLLPDPEYDYISEVLIPEGLIKSRVDKMAQQIFNDYSGRREKPLKIIVVMNGAFQFYADLLQAIKNVSL